MMFLVSCLVYANFLIKKLEVRFRLSIFAIELNIWPPTPPPFPLYDYMVIGMLGFQPKNNRGSSVRRPCSEEPHRREPKLFDQFGSSPQLTLGSVVIIVTDYSI